MEKYMPTLETLETRLENYVKVNELQHQSMSDKNDLQHRLILEKLDLIHLDFSKDIKYYGGRIDDLEEEVEKQKNTRIYIVAVATLLAFAISYLIPLFL